MGDLQIPKLATAETTPRNYCWLFERLRPPPGNEIPDIRESPTAFEFSRLDSLEKRVDFAKVHYDYPGRHFSWLSFATHRVLDFNISDFSPTFRDSVADPAITKYFVLLIFFYNETTRFETATGGYSGTQDGFGEDGRP